MPKDVPPPDGMRHTNLMAKLCSGSGEGVFGSCRDDTLDLALSSCTEGKFRKRSLHTKGQSEGLVGLNGRSWRARESKPLIWSE